MKKNYLALCIIALGSGSVAVGKPVEDLSDELVQKLLANGSIKESVGDDQIDFKTSGNGDEENNGDQELSSGETSTDSNDSVGVSDSHVETSSTGDETNASAASENIVEGTQPEGETATLVGGITKDGRIVELKDWKVPNLKKLAVDLQVKNANQLNKDALIEAITAVEFAAEQVNA